MPNQGLGAEIIADQWGFSRTQLDEFSLRSHERAAAAQDSGAFEKQIAPIAGVSQDEGIRRGGTLEGMAGLKTPFKEGGKITAGNSSQISDGSAALLITTSEFAAQHGLTPLARIHTAVVIGAAPMPMLTAPIPATEKALKKSGLQLSEIGAFEVNEAFASVPLAGLKDIGADDQLTNPLGGAIALGHPLGATGAIRAATLLHGLRRRKQKFGMVTMCIGTGMGAAGIFEAL
jgi:acetyl-CoA acetyltransferase family protein